MPETPDDLFWEAFMAERDAAFRRMVGDNDGADAAHMRAEAFRQQAIDLERSYGK